MEKLRIGYWVKNILYKTNKNFFDLKIWNLKIVLFDNHMAYMHTIYTLDLWLSCIPAHLLTPQMLDQVTYYRHMFNLFVALPVFKLVCKTLPNYWIFLRIFFLYRSTFNNHEYHINLDSYLFIPKSIYDLLIQILFLENITNLNRATILYIIVPLPS